MLGAITTLVAFAGLVEADRELYGLTGTTRASYVVLAGGALVGRWEYAPGRCFYYVQEGPLLPEHDAALGGVLEYSTQLFDASTIERIARHRRPGHPVPGYGIYEATLRLRDGSQVLFAFSKPPEADLVEGDVVGAPHALIRHHGHPEVAER